jgi:hypothetical protein
MIAELHGRLRMPRAYDAVQGELAALGAYGAPGQRLGTRPGAGTRGRVGPSSPNGVARTEK